MKKLIFEALWRKAADGQKNQQTSKAFLEWANQY